MTTEIAAILERSETFPEVFYRHANKLENQISALLATSETSAEELLQLILNEDKPPGQLPLSGLV